MEGNKQYVYSMTFDPDYLGQDLEVGVAWEKWLQGVWPVRGGGLEVEGECLQGVWPVRGGGLEVEGGVSARGVACERGGLEVGGGLGRGSVCKGCGL